MESQQQTVDQTDRSTDPWALALTSLPGLVGISLGAIYALGALQTTVQLNGAGLNPVDLFPLIPLNQILGRGIIVAIYPYGALVVLLLLALVLLHELLPITQRRIFGQAVPSPTRDGVRLVAIGIGLIWLFFFASWTTWVIGPPLLAYLHYGGRWAQKRVGRVKGILATAISLVVVVGGLNAAMTPEPLAEVSLSLRDGTKATGGLVANSGQTWYIAKSDYVRSIPDARVTEADIRSVSNDLDEQPSLGDLVEDLFG